MIAIPRPMPRPHLSFLTSIGDAQRETLQAKRNLQLPPTAMPIVDPAIPAMAHSRIALEALRGALARTAGLPTTAVVAARAAQRELASGYNLLRYRTNGPLPVYNVIQKFDATVNWLNVARNAVFTHRPRM